MRPEPEERPRSAQSGRQGQPEPEADQRAPERARAVPAVPAVPEQRGQPRRRERPPAPERARAVPAVPEQARAEQRPRTGSRDGLVRPQRRQQNLPYAKETTRVPGFSQVPGFRYGSMARLSYWRRNGCSKSAIDAIDLFAKTPEIPFSGLFEKWGLFPNFGGYSPKLPLSITLTQPSARRNPSHGSNCQG